MRISEIHIQNYRAHRDTTVKLDSLTALIGRNGTGKSSILYAIDFFYDVSRVLTSEDVFAGAEDEVAITVTYENLTADEKERFRSFIRDNALTVIKRAMPGEQGRYYGIYPQIPEFAQIRRMSGAMKQREEYEALRSSGRFPDLPSARSLAQVIANMAALEADPRYSSMLTPIERQEQFLGDKRVGGGSLDNSTSFVLVPAVHEAVEEVGKSGAIQTLVDRLVLTSLMTREDIQAFKDEFEKQYKEIYAPENLTEIETVSDSVNELLERYAPGSTIELRWRETTPPILGLPAYDTRLGDAEYNTPVPLQGHGMQRALILSLLQLLAQPQQNGDEDRNENVNSIPDLIIAIEEPELYHHPAQCRYLARLLTELSELDVLPYTQVIYATHSPYFVRIDKFESIRVIRRRAESEGEVPCCAVGSLPFEKLRETIANVADIEPSSITRESYIARCASVMDVVCNEGFFASVAVIVEGYGDLGCLRAIESARKLRWDEKGIVIVPARSKNNIDRPVQIFKGLGIPTYFVFDGDNSQKGKDGERSAKRGNRLLMKIAGIDPEDFPSTQVHETWAVIEDCLETELKASVPMTQWEPLISGVRDELGFGTTRDVLKNPDGMAEIVRSIYEAGGRLPVIENIAEQVTQLLSNTITQNAARL